MSINTIMITIVGVLWSIVGYLVKNEISRIREDFKSLRISLEVLAKDFYTLQGEHSERACKNAQ